MNYKEEIIKILDRIKNDDYLMRIYYFVKTFLD